MKYIQHKFIVILPGKGRNHEEENNSHKYEYLDAGLCGFTPHK